LDAKDVVALFAERLADDFLGKSMGVKVGRIYHVDPSLERDIEHPFGKGDIHCAAFGKFCATSERYGAQYEFRHEQA
jgi:hypothetical protein